MWPEVPVQTKFRIMPYLALLGLALLVADHNGIIDLAAAAQAVGEQAAVAPAHRHKHKHKHKPKHKAKATVPGRPSTVARADIPAGYLAQYRASCRGATFRARGGGRYPCWAVLAGIGKIESDHGRSSAPGVRSGVNRFGCCAGPMQFNLRNGPPSTWDRWGHGGDPYDPGDAIDAAARKLTADGAAGDLDGALYAYNHDWAYVARVKALARRYQDRRS